MTLEEADEIREVWGKFLEVANGGLLRIFRAQIPETVLPYPKHKIEEAMDVCIDYFASEGNDELVEVFKSSKAMLMAYTDDVMAINQAHKHFNNPAFMKVFKDKYSDFHSSS